MSLKLLTREDLLARGIKYSPSQLSRKMAAGTFPAAVRGAGKQNCWLETEIDQYIADLLEARTSRSSKQGDQAA